MACWTSCRCNCAPPKHRRPASADPLRPQRASPYPASPDPGDFALVETGIICMNTVTEPLVRLAARVDAIQPFYVMELAKEAAQLERQGRDIIHMGIGEPDFTAPEQVVEAAVSGSRPGVPQYTAASGR